MQPNSKLPPLGGSSLLIVELYLKYRCKNYNKSTLCDLFDFQEAVMAHPNGPKKKDLDLKYNWAEYFLFVFNLGEVELKLVQKRLNIADPKPSEGDVKKFIENHFDIRGVPAFNQLFDESGNLVFPPVHFIR